MLGSGSDQQDLMLGSSMSTLAPVAQKLALRSGETRLVLFYHENASTDLSRIPQQQSTGWYVTVLKSADEVYTDRVLQGPRIWR